MPFASIPSISNQKLRLKDIPKTLRGWQDFALTFNANEVHGGFNKTAKIANTRSPVTLTEFRTCLFFEQRTWRNSDCGFGPYEPSTARKAYVLYLLQGVRSLVQKGKRT